MKTYAVASPFDLAMGGAGVDIGVGRMHLFVTLDISRPFSHEMLKQAVAEVIQHFPVLGCRYVQGWWRDRWVMAPSITSADIVEWVETTEDLEATTHRLLRASIEPSTHWPWRVTQIHANGRCRLVLTVLHQVADGAGTLLITNAFAQALQRACEEASARASSTRTTPDALSLPGSSVRGIRPVLSSLRLSQIPMLAVSVFAEWLRPLWLPFLAKTALPSIPTTSSAQPISHAATIDIRDGCPLRLRCKQLGCTINDALVTALIMLVKSLSEKGRLGAFFTVDLRRYIQDQVPRVANLSSFDMITLPRSFASDFDQTAQHIARRTQKQKCRFVGLPIFLAATAITGFLPYALQRWMGYLGTRWIKMLANRGLVVTNIGSLDEALASLGDTVCHASVLGPFMANLSIPMITATSFRGRLTLQFNSFDSTPIEFLQQMAATVSEILLSPQNPQTCEIGKGASVLSHMKGPTR